MKALKSICTTAILTLSLAASVTAGELTTPGYTPPPPPPDTSTTEEKMSTPTETTSDQNILSTSDAANFFWLLASIF